MRIKSINLNRYGHFNDHTIDLGDTNTNKPDFHIVYGANEAGKSTTLSAIIDLLFGMPLKTKFNFLHKNDTLEISASLLQANGELSVKRFKNRLTDNNGNKISASAIDTHGLDRAEYIHRFSFDEEMLKAGGESILQNQGELGATLFSATSGLTNFTKSLNSYLLDSETNYHPNTRKLDKLVELKEQLETIKEEQKELDVTASAWSKRQKEASEKHETYRSFSNDAQERKAALNTLEKTHSAMGLAHKIADLERDMSSLENALTLPLSWITTARTMLGERTALQNEIAQAVEKSASLQNEIDTIQINETLIKNAATIEHLNQSKLLFIQRNDDLNNCTIELDKHEQHLDSLCKTLDIAKGTHIDSLYIAKPTLAALEQSLKQADHLQQRYNNAENELNKLQAQIDSNKGALVSSFIDITPLELYINEALELGLQAKIEQTQNRINELSNTRQLAFEALKPWQGSAEELLSVSEPKQLSELHAKHSSLQTTLTQHKKTISKWEFEKNELGIQLSSIEAKQEQPSPALTLNNRGKAWEAHTKCIDEQLNFVELQRTARAFSQAMHEHDSANQQTIKNSQSEELLMRLSQQIKTLENNIEQEQLQLEPTSQALHELDTTINRIKLTLCYSENEPFNSLIVWFKYRDHALHISTELSQAEANLTQLSENLEIANARLKDHINTLLNASDNNTDSSFLENAGFSETVNYAKNLRDKFRESNEQATQKIRLTESLEADLARRTGTYNETKTALNDAHIALRNLLKDTFLNSYSIELLPALLTTIIEFENTYQLRKSAQQKLSEIRAQQESFSTQVSDIAKPLNLLIQAQNNDPLSLISNLATELSHQQLQMSTKAQMQNELSSIELKLKQSNHNFIRINNDFENNKLLSANDDTLSLQKKLDDAQLLAEKRRQLVGLTQELTNLTGAELSKDALTELLANDPTHVQSQIADLNLQIEADQTQLQELHFAYRSAQDPLDAFQSNNRVAQLSQQKASLLLEIEQLAISALQVRLGHLAIHNGLDKFREKNKSSMLQRANTLFQTITCGNFTNLVSQPNGKGGDQLIAINKEGMSKQANEMSTGTRTQLYLALRVAAYQDYCELRPPLPFVADDIMETFDDERASATLGVLYEMANDGQVIYFTHHRHLLELAKKQMRQDVHIHELPARPKLTVVPK